MNMLSKIRRLFHKPDSHTVDTPATIEPAVNTTTRQAAVERPGKSKNAPKPVTRFSPDTPFIPRSSTDPKPFISIILIIYKMPVQALKTLHSLSTDYQQGVSAEDYEVIVVENESGQMLQESDINTLSGQFRYFHRQETQPTPVFAINYGASQASGSHICVMIDGARMVTPGVVSYMLAALRLAPSQAVVSVPGYHLGPKLQQLSVQEGYNEKCEAELLNNIDWPQNGYRLFEIACLSGTCGGGIFKPIGESNCICVSKETYQQLGGFDEAFISHGGGQVNLDFYKRAIELPGTLLFILPGEGSFHQLHGGATTGGVEDRQRSMELLFEEYLSLRGEPYAPPDKRAIYLGAVPDAALKYIQHGASTVISINGL